MKLNDRIRNIRKSLALGQIGFAEAIGVSQGTVSKWEDKTKPSDPGPDALIKIAEVAGITVDQLLRDDLFVNHNVAKVPLVGQIVAGATVEFFQPAQGDIKMVEGFSGASAGTVAAEVVGDALGDVFAGWLLFFNEKQPGVSPDSVGQPCVVWLDDGRILLRKVRQDIGSLAFTLLSSFAPPIYDAKITASARILNMQPG